MQGAECPVPCSPWGQQPGSFTGPGTGACRCRSLVLLTRGLLFSCLQLSQKFGSRARNTGCEEAVWAVPSGPVFPRDASSPAPSSVPAGVTVEMPGPGGAELRLEAAWFGRRPRRRSCRLALGAWLRWGACAAFEGRGQFVFAAGSLGFWWACHHGNPRC